MWALVWIPRTHVKASHGGCVCNAEFPRWDGGWRQGEPMGIRTPVSLAYNSDEQQRPLSPKSWKVRVKKDQVCPLTSAPFVAHMYTFTKACMYMYIIYTHIIHIYPISIFTYSLGQAWWPLGLWRTLTFIYFRTVCILDNGQYYFDSKSRQQSSPPSHHHIYVLSICLRGLRRRAVSIASFPFVPNRITKVCN